VSDGRLVYFASEEKPTLAHEALGPCAARASTKRALRRQRTGLARDLKPISNPHGSAKLRLRLQRALTRRALGVAALRAGLAS
jgi:CO/xanthine dehydrogenase FAD-binding subunit